MTDSTYSATEPRASRLPGRFTVIHLAFLQAVVAMAGSLYFSEVMKFPPCNLCWYQRIAMYPIVAILGIGIWRRDANARYYALPLSLIGLAISLYHNAMTYNFVPAGACAAEGAVSCLTRWINWGGFITIPLMAFVAFVVISVCLIMYTPRVEDVE
jgi:disulfide bond formation protein DsbB